VLVIEDEEGIRKFITRVLEPTYEVHLAEHGGEGLNKARWVKPDLILLDLRMPGLNGLTVLAKLKAQPATREIPVIIVSVAGDSEMLMECQRGGASDQVMKPFDVEDLRKVIARQVTIRREGQEPSAGKDAGA
jgi:CheY-like chemotaxis protein